MFDKQFLLSSAGICAAVAFAARPAPALADAKTLDAFIQRYQSRAGIIQSRFCAATYEALRTQCDHQGTFSVADSLSVLMRDDKFRLVSHCVRSAKPDLPAGSIWVCGGDEGQYFSALKPTGRSEFVFSAYGKDAFAISKSRNQCLTAVAPFAVATTTVKELLSSSKFVPIDAEHCTAGGQPAVKITFKPNDSTMTTQSLELTVLAESMYLLDYEVKFAHFSLYGENRYTGGGVTPELKEIETWSQPTGSKLRLSDQKIIITSFRAANIADAEFTPLAAGIMEVPASVSPPRD